MADALAKLQVIRQELIELRDKGRLTREVALRIIARVADLDERLASLSARIGKASASCGSDRGIVCCIRGDSPLVVHRCGGSINARAALVRHLAGDDDAIRLAAHQHWAGIAPGLSDEALLEKLLALNFRACRWGVNTLDCGRW